jgi:hypothetical protein
MPDDPTATADPGVDTDTATATAADDSTPASTPAAAPDTPAQAPPTTAAPGPGAPPAAAPPPQADQTPAATLQPAPNIVRPKRGGLAGVMDEIADDLAGPGSVHTDGDGNEYINRKGQWLKIAGEALRGAAAGAAVAQGPGGAWRGAAAGIKAGDEQAQREQQAQQQQTQEARQAKQDQFNAVMQKHNLAAKEFELQRMGVKANQDDIKFAQEQNDREEKLGSADLGMVKDEADLADQMSKQQGFWKDVHRNEINAVPEYGSDGQRLGLHVWKRIPGIGDQQTDPGTPIRIWDAGNKKMTEQVPTVPLTHNQVDAYNHTADNLQRQSQIDDNAEAYKAQQTATSEAEEESHRATTRKSNAETKKIQGETAAQGQTAAGAGKSGEEYLATLPPDQAALVRDVGTGKAAPERISNLLGRGQSKSSQQLMAQVAAAYPDLDTSKLAAYPKTYQDYTSGKTAQALNSGATVLLHLDNLQKLNTVESHIPHTPDYTAYKNQADTLAPELAKFYGHSSDADIASYKDTLMSQLPGNRKAAITTQAASMGKKFDSYQQQWRNAAPSAAYEAPMPGMSDAAKLARGRLDPEYGSKLFSVGQWQKANPQGDPKAAQAAAKQKGLEVIQ